MKWLTQLWHWLVHWFGFDSENPSSTDQISSATSSPPATLVTPELALETDENPLYKQSQSVFTYQERRFFRALRQAIGKKYEIFPKIRLADFVYLSNLPKDQKHHWNQIQCKHIDYLLCTKFDFKPILAIELDDSSHKRFERKMSDEFKSVLLEGVGLPLLRFKVQQSYDVVEIAAKISSRLEKSPQSHE